MKFLKKLKIINIFKDEPQPFSVLYFILCIMFLVISGFVFIKWSITWLSARALILCISYILTFNYFVNTKKIDEELTNETIF